MPDILRHGPSRDEFTGPPLVEAAGSQASAGFGFDILDQDGRRPDCAAPQRLGPFPATLDNRETHCGPLLPAVPGGAARRIRLSPSPYRIGNIGHLAYAEISTPMNSSILYVMAAEAEYGPHLRQRIVPLMTGVGPVEAAIAVTRELARRERPGTLPALVVSLGSAGSRRLERCGVFQASSVSYRDMDASPLGFPKGQTPFLDLPPVMPLQIVPGIPQASLSTGANIVSGIGYDAIEEDMVDMETYAVLRACQSFSVPLIALRGISDGVDELRHMGDWTEYLHVIDRKLAAAIDLIEAAMPL